ncbi:9831_t:CDS:1, partial [Gigaspora rosea]
GKMKMRANKGDPKGPSKGKEPNKLTFTFPGSQSEPVASQTTTKAK